MNKDESVVYLAANKVTGSITIPNTVKIIKDYAFYDCEYTSITIPESVEEIGYAAFSQCSYLKNLTIPSSINIIKNEAFSYCNSLESLTLSSNAINKLNVNVLYSNEYKEVYGYLEPYKAWPTNLKTINIVSLDEDSSFNIPSSNYVETVNIGENIDVINEGLLRPFKQLTTINVGDNSNYKVIDGLLYNGNLTTLLCVPSNYTGSLNIIPSVTRIGDSALYSYKGSSSITLNENITEIGRSAFADTDFTSIELPEGLLNIGNYAFYYSDISSMIIPDSVQTIGQGAFAGCYSLESLVLPFVGESLTENRNLLHLFGWYYINKELFAEFPASLKRLELSDSCTSLAEDSFNYNNTLEVIVIGKGVEEIPQSLFDIESLKEINVSELNKKYASFNGILYSKDYTKMIYCPVKKEGAVTTREEVKELDDNAFYGRALITSISLPDNLEKIGINLFGACDLLTFTESNDALYIGSTLNPYLILVKGKEEATSVTINETCKFILNSAFKNCASLKTVVLNELVDSIGDETFEDCTSLETITIPDNILTIGKNAFKNCASLKSIAIPDSVSKIGFGAFYGCESLESIRIPFIGESEEEDSNSYFGFIFGNIYRTTDSYSDNVPDSLTSLYLGNKINNIYGYSLNIRHLKNIYLSESVEMIEEYAFHSSVVTTEYEGGKYIGTIDNPYYYLSNASNVQVLNIHKDCKIINLSIRRSLEYLSEINVPEENEYYASVDGVLYSKDMTILLACPMKKSELVIPEGVEEVKGAQFNYRELRSISIPSTLKTIEWNFYSVNRPSFTITISPSNNYYTIDDKLLLNKDKTELIYNFDYSKYFEVPEAITSIKSNAFVNMPYSKTIVINNNINNIEQDVFSKWSTIILNTSIDNMSPYLKEYFNDIVDDKKGYIIELDDCVVIQMVYPV